MTFELFKKLITEVSRNSLLENNQSLQRDIRPKRGIRPNEPPSI